jgi:hypothetical protein
VWFLWFREFLWFLYIDYGCKLQRKFKPPKKLTTFFFPEEVPEEKQPKISPF